MDNISIPKRTKNSWSVRWVKDIDFGEEKKDEVAY